MSRNCWFVFVFRRSIFVFVVFECEILYINFRDLDAITEVWAVVIVMQSLSIVDDTCS